MRINADFTQRAVVNTETAPWVASPLAGVERRFLDRIGNEVARATTIVRYAPDSSFTAHAHDGGEEFLVLEGVFSDEHGHYGPGFYVRNPRGSTHTPYSRGGCTIFVKLFQIDPADQTFVRIDTNKGTWREEAVPGISRLTLHQFGGERTSLVRYAPGTRFPAHDHPGGEEILVLDGTLADETGTYPKGTWLRLPPGSHHAPWSDTGCTLFVKSGHLNTIDVPAGV